MGDGQFFPKSTKNTQDLRNASILKIQAIALDIQDSRYDSQLINGT